MSSHFLRYAIAYLQRYLYSYHFPQEHVFYSVARTLDFLLPEVVEEPRFCSDACALLQVVCVTYLV